MRAAKKALKYVNEKRLIDLGLEYLTSLETDAIPLVGAAPAAERTELVAGDSQTR